MSLTRTTLRIDTNLKKEAERQATEDETTLQAIFNDALEQYLNTKSKLKATRIVFQTHDLGTPLDGLKRGDFYPEV